MLEAKKHLCRSSWQPLRCERVGALASRLATSTDIPLFSWPRNLSRSTCMDQPCKCSFWTSLFLSGRCIAHSYPPLPPLTHTYPPTHPCHPCYTPTHQPMPILNHPCLLLPSPNPLPIIMTLLLPASFTDTLAPMARAEYVHLSGAGEHESHCGGDT